MPRCRSRAAAVTHPGLGAQPQGHVLALLPKPCSATLRLTPKHPQLPPCSAACPTRLPSKQGLKVAPKAAKATAATSIFHLLLAPPSLTLRAPQATSTTARGQPFQQHVVSPPWNSEPEEKEHNMQLEDGSKLREWKRKPLQAWQLIKRKK